MNQVKVLPQQQQAQLAMDRLIHQFFDPEKKDNVLEAHTFQQRYHVVMGQPISWAECLEFFGNKKTMNVQEFKFHIQNLIIDEIKQHLIECLEQRIYNVCGHAQEITIQQVCILTQTESVQDIERLFHHEGIVMVGLQPGICVVARRDLVKHFFNMSLAILHVLKSF